MLLKISLIFTLLFGIVNCQNTSVSKNMTCPPKEVYMSCGPDCNTCEWLGKKCPIVHIICPFGCFCIPGYVRNDKGRCIKESCCPKPKCRAYEEYLSCGPACVPFCTKEVRKCAQPPVCPKGCYCIDGFIRDENNRCIPIKDCKYIALP